MAVSRVDFEGRTLIDLTGDTVDAASLLEGRTAHGANGEAIAGAFPRIWYAGRTICAPTPLVRVSGDTLRVEGEYKSSTKTLWIGEVS